MRKLILLPFRLFFCAAISATLAFPATVNVGYVSFDLTFPANVGEFDITNGTGPNSTPAPDMTFPITNSVSLSGLSLEVHFKSGTTSTFGSSYFTLASDGLSFDGNPSFNQAIDPIATAILSGTFATTTFTLNNGSSFTADPSFSTTITNSSGLLQDGDFGLILGSPAGTGGGGGPAVPEPATWLLLCGGLAILVLVRRSRARSVLSVAAVLVAAFALAPAMRAQNTVHLNTSTTPSSGVAGSTQVWVAGSGFPNPIPPADTTVTLAATCGGAAVATTPGLMVTQIIGTSDRIEFLVPGSLNSGLYFVSVSGMSSGGTTFTSGNCSQIQVTKTATVFGSCNPGSSMGILVPAAVPGGTAPVTAYVPNSAWSNRGTGVQAVPIEGGGSFTSIPTTDFINSCSTNSVTGVSVCTANGAGANVYLLSGTSVTTTVKSASNSTASFSGGTCFNCGVAVNSVTNQAVITMGFSGATSALQFLDLNTNTFGAPVPATHEISEDVLWDPFSNQILSPNESLNYDIFQITGPGVPGPGTVTESSKAITVGEADSAGEDCTTGIALTVGEGTGQVFLADLKQATFTGTSWTAPSAVYSLPEFLNLAAGASAVAVAPGSTHLGVVAGEFGGNSIGIIQLPATSGSGTPVIVDYVLAVLPATPDGAPFANGFDPHTTTAYTSPNDQKAYGVAASWATGTPSYLAVIDLAAALAAPRTGAHTISSSVNLLTTGIVRYVKAK